MLPTLVRNLEGQPYEHHGESAEGHVDVEGPAPGGGQSEEGVGLGEETTDQRTDHAAAAVDQHEQRHVPAAFPGRD